LSWSRRDRLIGRMAAHSTGAVTHALAVEQEEKKWAKEHEAEIQAEVTKRLASMKSGKPVASRRRVVEGQHGGWRPGAGRPVKATSEAQAEPWVALGLSKATYYRRKRKGELG
jgi:hypothetical protein